MSKFIRGMPAWPQPSVPADGLFFFYDAASDQEYKLVPEQLIGLSAGRGPNAEKSLLKEFRFYRKADRDADASGGACFETDLDWSTCCAFTVVKIEFYRERDTEAFRAQELVCVFDPSPTDPTHTAYADGSFSGPRNPSKFVPATDPLALSYTSAYPLVCERADGTTNFTFTTLHEAVTWTNGGGAGSTTYVNRPLQVQTFVTLAAGTVLDLQYWPIDVNDWVIRLGPGAVIRHNRLLYAGRLAPFEPTADPTANICTVQGGTVACRLNFQSSPAATVMLDDVVVTDFGQSAVPGITGGHLATTFETDAKVELRGGARFTPDYPPHPNTSVTVVPEGGAGGLATRDLLDLSTDFMDSVMGLTYAGGDADPAASPADSFPGQQFDALYQGKNCHFYCTRSTYDPAAPAGTTGQGPAWHYTVKQA